MDQALHYLQIFLLLNLLPGLLHIARGPSNTDRLLAIQLSSTTGVALLLVMSHTISVLFAYDCGCLECLSNPQWTLASIDCQQCIIRTRTVWYWNRKGVFRGKSYVEKDNQ
jgi:multisubunit Na+/H+ antiporter MnhF subunit